MPGQNEGTSLTTPYLWLEGEELGDTEVRYGDSDGGGAGQQNGPVVMNDGDTVASKLREAAWLQM